MQCKNCNSSSVKSRSNYHHGKQSKATMTYTCRKCGSSEVLKKEKKWRKR